MKKSLLAMAVILAFALASAAQTGSTSSNATSTGKTDKSATSSGKSGHGVVGCLEQGSSPGTYVIKNAKHPEGVQVSYSGSEDLSKHVGHKVKATGSMSGDTLNATNVKHISETCNVGSESASGGHKHHHGDMSNSSTGSGTGSTSGTGASSGTGSSNPK